MLIGAASQGLEIFKYAPAQIKRAVADHGAASKEQMRSIVAATLGLSPTLEIDAADALAVGMCHISQQHALGAVLNEIPPGHER